MKNHFKTARKKAFIKQVLLLISSIYFVACKPSVMISDNGTSASQKSQTSYGSNWDLTTVFPGSGTYTGVSSAISASDICSTQKILGATGTVDCNGTFLQSNACRNAGMIVVPQFLVQLTTSSQLTQNAEAVTYAGSSETPALPVTGGFNYRDIPDVNKDDDGYDGFTMKYAPRPVVTCGTTGNISVRIADCVSKNAATATWDGSVYGSGGQSVWNLVTRSALNKEVWKDARTGLIWSSLVNSSTGWCQASGNTQAAAVTLTGLNNMTGNGTLSSVSGGSLQITQYIYIEFTSPTSFTVTGAGSGCGDAQGGAITSGALTGSAGSMATYGLANYCHFTITQGSTPFASGDTFTLYSVAASESCTPGAASALQPALPISLCVEGAGFDQTAGGSENWATGTYSPAKGYMGATSTDKVLWRLPTLNDYEQADLDGIAMVLPDMGIYGSVRPAIDASIGATTGEWSATTSSQGMENIIGHFVDGMWYRHRSAAGMAARCVGR